MISVIIPALNEEKSIGATLKNLASLRGKDFEIIVSDGKSTDRTVEIARTHADKVVSIPDISKRTIALQRNRGAAAASGEYFAFIDATVIIPHPSEFFKKTLARFGSDDRLVGLTSLIKVSPEKATWADAFFFGLTNLMQIIGNNFLHIGNGTGKFQMVRADAFRRVGGYREDLVVTEDNEFFYRLSRVGKTRVDTSLTIFHDGRRAHAIGWPRMLLSWARNAVSLFLFDRSSDKEWRHK